MRLPQDASLLWKGGYFLAIFFRHIFCKVYVQGAEHVPRSGGCILASNHNRGPDFLTLAWGTQRQIYFMAKIEAFQIHPILSKILSWGGVFPVRRGAYDTEALTEAVKLIESGKLIGMFPEGTRSQTGALQRGKSGVARLAMQTGAPVVPAVTVGAPQVFRRFWRQWRRREVHVRFGPALYLDGDVANLATVRNNSEKVMVAMASLLPPELRGPYADQVEQQGALGASAPDPG